MAVSLVHTRRRGAIPSLSRREPVDASDLEIRFGIGDATVIEDLYVDSILNADIVSRMSYIRSAWMYKENCRKLSG